MPYSNEEIYRTVKRIEEILTGNGHPANGLVVRVDRLEQAEQRRGWWSKTALGAAITAAIGSLWAITKGHS